MCGKRRRDRKKQEIGPRDSFTFLCDTSFPFSLFLSLHTLVFVFLSFSPFLYYPLIHLKMNALSPQITTALLVLGTVQISRNLDLENPDTINYVRLGYGISQVIIIAILFYIKTRVFINLALFFFFVATIMRFIQWFISFIVMNIEYIRERKIFIFNYRLRPHQTKQSLRLTLHNLLSQTPILLAPQVCCYQFIISLYFICLFSPTTILLQSLYSCAFIITYEKRNTNATTKKKKKKSQMNKT